jgi:L-alanine-DL-glutamate epimerase-like enolase superfamily enzyme
MARRLAIQNALWEAKGKVLGESSATLPLSAWGRVARHTPIGRC